MIIIFVTDTFFEWGRVFLESFKIHHGDRKIRIHVNGAFLTKEQMNHFRGIYKNLTISNVIYEPSEIIKRFKVTNADYQRCKKNISVGIKDKCRWWMDFIAVEERIKRLLATINASIKNNAADWWLQLDVDMMFRKPITPILDLLKENDIIARFRPDQSFMIEEDGNVHMVPQHLRVCAGMLGFNGKHTIKLIEDWIDEIHSRPPNGIHGRFDQKHAKPWGQYTLFNAYLKNKENFKWGEIGQEWLTTNCLPEEPIWCGHRKNVLKYYDKNGNMTKKIRIGDRAGFRNMIFLPELARMKRNKK
jgi:hypothetical protein